MSQPSDSPLSRWNSASPEEAIERLLTCCASLRWARSLVDRRPFISPAALSSTAEELWFSLDEQDWLEAFACHPRIGERKAPATEYLAHSDQEQSAAQQTLTDVADALLEGNRLYEQRFGFLYIVFACGRSASELLDVLQQRLTHTRAEELHEAARQQQRITALRMAKWLQPHP